MAENYRPISLLAVGYKIMASIILGRLKSGGVEKKLSNSQFGFRRQRSTADALFLVRRMIDAAIANSFCSEMAKMALSAVN